MKTNAGIRVSSRVLGLLLALSPLACSADKAVEPPPVVAKATAAEPAAHPATPGPGVPGGTSEATNVVAAEPLLLSPAMEELVRLLQSGVGVEVIEAFITNSPVPFHAGSAELVHLHDLGAPPAVLTALIRHDAQPAMVALKQVSGPTTPAPAPVPGAPAAPVAAAPEAKAPVVPNPPEPTSVAATAPAAVTSAPVPASTTEVYQVPAETRTVSYSYFYSSLAPYGAWVDVPGYGSCWRPTVAVYQPAWRPYCDGGRWLWSDRGWYWYSTYSWGWAPFHYGRWCQPTGLGWVWVPDTHWGPSWVSWRYSSGHCGWAPLPPAARWTVGVGFHTGGGSVGVGFDFGLASSAYVFCPLVRFCDPRPVAYCVPRHQHDGLYRDSTVINNYVVGNNNTIINQGVGYERVAKVAKGELRRVTVKEVASLESPGPRSPLGPRHERLSDDGGTLKVHRPPVVLAASTTPETGTRPGAVSGPRSVTRSVSNPVSGGGFSKPSTQLAPSTSLVSSPPPATTVPPVTGPGPKPVTPRVSAPVTQPGTGLSSTDPAGGRTVRPVYTRRNDAPTPGNSAPVVTMPSPPSVRPVRPPNSISTVTPVTPVTPVAPVRPDVSKGAVKPGLTAPRSTAPVAVVPTTKAPPRWESSLATPKPPALVAPVPTPAAPTPVRPPTTMVRPSTVKPSTPAHGFSQPAPKVASMPAPAPAVRPAPMAPAGSVGSGRVSGGSGGGSVSYSAPRMASVTPSSRSGGMGGPVAVSPRSSGGSSVPSPFGGKNGR
ncbi:MAG: hypothetical protein RJA22_2556 [Verrucomicrobiota bacterium]|jgi:hypothetical protein